MKKQNILNLIKYHIEDNDNSFVNEAINIAKYFDKAGDTQLAEYIMGMISTGNLYTPQTNEFEIIFLKKINIEKIDSLSLPMEIASDIQGVINATKHNIGINKFLFEGLPGSGKTEGAKHITKLLKRNLYYVNFDGLIDSKLGQTNKNISILFDEINSIIDPENTVILFDEIDVIALNRIDSSDVREMGRATSSILREFDKLTNLKKKIIIIATTNLYENFDKALSRRFDAVINFNRYSNEDLIEVANNYLSLFIKKFKNSTRDTKLFNKILNISKELPYPGEMKNIIRASLAFSNPDFEYEYLKRIYSFLIKNIDNVEVQELGKQGFTSREIAKIKEESKSSISRKLNKKGDDSE
ncbi:ATP-binding protein [Photobacterium phosphoreum]|uniref:ATP-binding protein n=1 Tax=Photobacterium phosphoreum TaxID=659 RepID=UPI0024B6DD26|nr:ATP-binding protein [Photobacterium phosphoreum]